MSQTELIKHAADTLSRRLGKSADQVESVLVRYKDQSPLPGDAPRWIDSVLGLIRLRRSAETFGGLDGQGVQILSMRDQDVCEPCFSADGDRYIIEKAIKELPLPHPDCENDVCRCTYRPLLKMDTT